MIMPRHHCSTCNAAARLMRARFPAFAVTLIATLPLSIRAQEVEQEAEQEAEEQALPLEPASTVEFTTSEGSWMSLDVSPDGRTIVFDLLGDLYTLPITGGTATRLTHGMAFDAQPRFSPDGTRIAFTSDRSGGENIWILSLDLRDTVRVTQGEGTMYHSPEWTPDGQYIIASRLPSGTMFSPSELWMYHVDGGTGMHIVAEPPEMRMSGVAFGSDPRYIWFAERMGEGNWDWEYQAMLPQYQLSMYDRETGKRYTRTARSGSAFRPALSPDGRWLVYGTRRDQETGLVLRDLRTDEERWLAYPVQRDEQEARATRDILPGMSFTPDSRAVVVSYGGGIWRVPIDGSAATEIPFTAHVSVPVGPTLAFDYPIEDSPTFVVKQIRDLAPSPDGRHLAFVAMDKLWIREEPDGEPRRLTDSSAAEYQPTWSPDGQWIAFATWSDDGEGHLYKVRVTGADAPIRLTSRAGRYMDPVWSPDGTRIVAVRSSAPAFRDITHRAATEVGRELVWIPSEGGEATRITPIGSIRRPHFARDPNRIYYTISGLEGELKSIRLDGEDEQTHVKITGRPPPGGQAYGAKQILMSPRGDRVIAEVQRQLYLVSVPDIGGEPPTVSVAKPDNAIFPVRQLTTLAAEFPIWSADGQSVHYAIGNAHFVQEVPGTGARTGIGTSPDSLPEPRENRIRIVQNRDIPQGEIVLRNARVITMQGDEVLERADILVRNNRITQVGAAGTMTAQDGRVLDLTGKTIVPGFVDTHGHLRVSQGVHRHESWQYLANLAYGVTTTRDPQTSTTDVLTYEDLIRAGEMLGPRVFSTGEGIGRNYDVIQTQEEARNFLRLYSEYYDTKTIKAYTTGNRKVRQWIAMAAREFGLMPTTEGALDMKLDLTQIIDGFSGSEHSFPNAPLYSDIARLMAATKVTYSPTLLVAYGGPGGLDYFYQTEEVHTDAKLRNFVPRDFLDREALRRPQWFREEEYVFPRLAAFLETIVDAGGRIGVGSHGELQGLGYHWELWAMESGGLSPHDVLRAATLWGAESIGLGNDIGSIESGKLADLLVLDENPLDDIRNTNTIRYVMRNGRLYEADTLDEIWPRQRELGPRWWQDQEPVP